MKKWIVIFLCFAMLLSLGAIGFTASAAETVLYVKDGGTGDGTSEANAFGDFKTAFEAAADLSGDAKLIVVGTVPVPLTEYFISPLYDHLITVVGKDDSSILYFINGKNQVFHFGGDAVIDDITLVAENPGDTIIFCANLRNVTFGPGFKSDALMSLRGTYKHNGILSGEYGYNALMTEATADYTLTVMGGSNWNDIAGYAHNSAYGNLQGTVTINVGGGAKMNTICIARNARVTATNAVINIHDAVINRFVGATDRDPIQHLQYDDATKTVQYNSGVSGSLTVNVFSDFDASQSFTNLASSDLVVPGISGTSIYILSTRAPEKGLTDVESLGSHTLNIDAAVFDAVIEHVQTVSFDSINKVNLGDTPAPVETQPVETQAPETKAPETTAPETKAPETKAPETKAPETKAPETKAPVDTTGAAAQEPDGGVPAFVWVILAAAAVAVAVVAVVLIKKKKK
ncbi:MAG: hypothetical protein IJR89_08510 [Clostridia bacterium]|nr:hypothetical protein [Clostridia bacterium]